jgi:general secretion pathway protein K
VSTRSYRASTRCARSNSRGRTAPDRRRRESGVVLALVLILALLLSASIITFSRRAVIDTMIVRNRDNAAQAEALARGGVRLAIPILLEDKLLKSIAAFGNSDGLRPVTIGNTSDDPWNQIRDYELVNSDGETLQIEIRDSGSLLNLNAVVPYTGSTEPAGEDAEEFLTELLTKVIDEMPLEPGEKLYDPRDLARNLVDYLDADDIRVVGGLEDEYYLTQDPPYRAANRPLLSVEELGLVEGFDVQLMDRMKSYVTVYPVVGGSGVNLNTAPPHVLALVYHGVAGARRLASGDVVKSLLKLRDEGRVACTASAEGASPAEGCVTLSELGLGEGSIFPPVALPAESDSFTVTSRATVGEIERTLVAVVDRSKAAEPQVLFWRMQ